MGVNTLVEEEDIQMKALRVLEKHAEFEALFEYSTEFAEKQIRRVEKVKRERDEEAVVRAREELAGAMREGRNMVPPLVEAVKQGLTRGEFARVKGVRAPCRSCLRGGAKCRTSERSGSS
ncbi:MAG: hypothetical protein JRH05_16765 [Deltaproteobacteria bacterium]|nr:hypothetical protein [Deltaproteobacteria bacterium]